jgi:hypothetical protein
MSVGSLIGRSSECYSISIGWRMDSIKEFVDSDDAAWEVTRSAFLTQLIDEIVNFPNVYIVISGTQTYLINKAHVSVKVKAVNNGGDSESVGGES